MATPEKQIASNFRRSSSLGINKLKKLLVDDFVRTFTIHDLQHILDMLNSTLSLYDLTGYPKTTVIPGREASVQVIDYFQKNNKFNHLLKFYIGIAQNGFKGKQIAPQNMSKILSEMSVCGYFYRNDIDRVVKTEQKCKRNDWGFLEPDCIYNFCFVSVDICGNSKLVRKYDQKQIHMTYKNFKNMVIRTIEKRNGRIWSWEGDGGLLAFHIMDSVNDAVVSAMDILSEMYIFNACENFLNEEIKIRLGINNGSARYKCQTSLIASDALEKTREIEKYHTHAMSISVSPHTFAHINAILRHYFILKEINNEKIYHFKFPLRS